jgi:hypothetical protein
MFSKASTMPSALTSWFQPCQTRKLLFSFFYLFEIKFSFQVWQGPQQGYQHQRLNCRPAKPEMLQKKILKQKINKEIKLTFSLKYFKFDRPTAKQSAPMAWLRPSNFGNFSKRTQEKKKTDFFILFFLKCFFEIFHVQRARSHAIGTEDMAAGPLT